jgi:hypothetical protein
MGLLQFLFPPSKNEMALRGILTEVATQFGGDQVLLIQELMGQAEMGLALEFICDWLTEKDFVCSPALYSQIETLGKEMGLDPKNWQMLQPKH